MAPSKKVDRNRISRLIGARANFLITNIFVAFLARGCGRQNIAWGGAQRNPRYDQDLSRKPADAGDSHWLNDDEMANNKITKSCRPLRGLDVPLRNIPGVPPSAPPQAIFCRPHPRA